MEPFTDIICKKPITLSVPKFNIKNNFVKGTNIYIYIYIYKYSKYCYIICHHIYSSAKDNKQKISPASTEKQEGKLII